MTHALANQNEDAQNEGGARNAGNGRPSNHFVEWVRDSLLRGGRMTKFAGKAASYAPSFAGVISSGIAQAVSGLVGGTASLASRTTSSLAYRLSSSISPGALAIAIAAAATTGMGLTITGAQAGTCIETGGAGSGIWTCSGPAGADVTQAPTSAPGGALTVTTAAGFGITTAAGNAIALINAAADTEITFTDTNNSPIVGDNNGILAFNNGTDALSITTTGAVTGTNYYGIFARNYGTSLTITTGPSAVTGATNGIFAFNHGNDALSITTTGAVTGTNSNGIFALNYRTSLTITTGPGAVTGGNSGIVARNYGTDALSITTTGAVTGTNFYGIFADNSANGTSLTITTGPGAVAGDNNGIFALNNGTDALSITTTGTVTGTIYSGINAVNSFRGTSLTITTGPGAVTGGNSGIVAVNYGTDAVSITTTGAVTGTNSNGIFALNYGTSLTITTGPSAVTGGNIGILAVNNGTDALSITTTGGVTGTLYSGINAVNRGTSLTITTGPGAVTGGSDGIVALNYGTDALSITTTGTVTGTNDDGIFAHNSANGTSLTINASGPITGGDDGISANNYGSGAISVTTTGTVTGTTDEGIDVYNSAAGTSLTIVADGNVNGFQSGIQAINYGSGGLSITVNGNVTSQTVDGINAYNSANDVTASMVINQAAGTTTTGAINGINANNFGGSLTINALGTSIGTAGDGIYADNNAGTTFLTITANNATGGNDGIEARNYGSGETIITASGTITGGTGYGLRTLTGLNGTTRITLNSGASVSSTAGLGIFNDAGDSFTVVNTGASVAGEIRLGDGSDALTFAGGDFSGVTIFDGGDDISVADTFIDTLTFSNTTASITGANVLNWENVVIDTGAMISFSDNMLTARTTTATNGGVFDAGTAFTLTGDLVTSAGGIFDATGGGAGVFAINGNVTNDGIITTQDGAAGDVITVSGDFTGTGGLNIDTVLDDGVVDTTDLLVVNGNTTGTTTINVTSAGGGGALTGTGATDGIQIVQVGGLSSSTAFVLGGAVTEGLYAYSLVQPDGQNWYLQSSLQGQFLGYSALQTALREDVDTLWHRVGQRSRLVNRDGTSSKSGSGFWLRTVYSTISADTKVTVGADASENNLDYTRNLVQFGYDHKVLGNGDGMLVAGVFGHYKHLDLKVFNATSLQARGKGDGYGGGVSLTWNASHGFYGDLVGQLTSWKTKVTGTNGGSGSVDALTYSVSAEGGYRFDITGGARLVPQGQLVWQGSNFDNFTDSNGLAVSWNERSNLTGRVGIALEGGNPVSKGGNGLTGYVIANLVHDFSKVGSLTSNGVNIKTQTNQTRIEGRLGVNLSTDDDGLTFFGEGGFAHSISGKRYNSFKGVVGARWNF